MGLYPHLGNRPQVFTSRRTTSNFRHPKALIAPGSAKTITFGKFCKTPGTIPVPFISQGYAKSASFPEIKKVLQGKFPAGPANNRHNPPGPPRVVENLRDKHATPRKPDVCVTPIYLFGPSIVGHPWGSYPPQRCDTPLIPSESCECTPNPLRASDGDLIGDRPLIILREHPPLILMIVRPCLVRPDTPTTANISSGVHRSPTPPDV